MTLRSEKGISLVEIMIAILIFGIGISAAIRVLPVSNEATTRSRNLTIATNLAQQKIEELMGATYNSAGLAAGSHADPDNPLERIFTRTWRVTDNDPLNDMKRVEVTVEFVTRSEDDAVTLTTFITSRR